MQENVFGFSHMWVSGDTVSHSVAVILGLMSIVSWYLIVLKLFNWVKLRRSAAKVGQFWSASSIESGIEALTSNGLVQSPYAKLATQAYACNSECADSANRLVAKFDAAEQMERALRQQLSVGQARMENGLTVLATAGATAPFVGLFGTVWGIYHALVAIGMTGQASLDKVAAPVGEALIMTAAGLAVALPAVFAYNAFTRINRVYLSDLDAFAHDLHAFFTIGKPFVGKSAQIHPVRAKVAAGVA